MTETQVIGRNEPCPCKSGKKYKRCCGINAAPKLTPPKEVPAGGFSPDALAGGLPGGLEGMDPQMMMQVSQAIQRLPKGQVQRLQAIMQKAMSGKDVTAEAEQFEKTLPLEFQNMIHSLKPPTDMMAAGQPEVLETSGKEVSSMTEEEARALVAKAAAEGAIPKEQAETLLQAPPEAAGTNKGKFGKFWSGLSGGKK